MTTEVFNAAAHACLLALGYTHERIAASWEDDGDAENGPHLSGHDAYDLYTDATSQVMISETDSAFELRDLELEAFIEAMGIECDAIS